MRLSACAGVPMTPTPHLHSPPISRPFSRKGEREAKCHIVPSSLPFSPGPVWRRHVTIPRYVRRRTHSPASPRCVAIRCVALLLRWVGLRCVRGSCVLRLVSCVLRLSLVCLVFLRLASFFLDIHIMLKSYIMLGSCTMLGSYIMLGSYMI